MTIYQIEAEISEEAPWYTFFIKANNEKEAKKIAFNIIWNDYMEYFDDTNRCKNSIQLIKEINEIEDLLILN